MSESTSGSVYLVGAGPGNVGLLTLRAVELLSQADLVLHDQLVPKRILDFARPGSEIISIRDLPGQHPDKYPAIFQTLIEAAQAGRTVVRLKGGDPLIFGRGGEEAEVLRQAGVKYEIVPGVTAALAAAAFMDLPLTQRGNSSAVALVTGHELPQKPTNKLDWQVLANFPGTLAIYMGIARLPILVAELLKFGKDPKTPAAIIQNASTGDMRSVFTTLGELDQAKRNSGLEAPGLILLGESIRQVTPLSWFEAKPLFGQRVLVCRPVQQAAALRHELELRGAVTSLLPTMRIEAPTDYTELDAAITEFQQPNLGWHWLVFTSANGVRYLMDRLFELGKDVRVLGQTRIAVVGAKTAKALETYHLRADLVPKTFSSAGLLAELLPLVTGQRVLLARANRGSSALPNELAKVATVLQATVYHQVDELDVESEEFSALRRGELKYVLVSSLNIAKELLRNFDETLQNRVLRGDIVLIAWSQEVADGIRELGLTVGAIAKVPTDEGMVEALIQYVKDRPPSQEEHPSE